MDSFTWSSSLGQQPKPLESAPSLKTAASGALFLLAGIPEIAPYVGPVVQALNKVWAADEAVRNDVEYMMEFLHKIGSQLQVIRNKPRKSPLLIQELTSLAERMKQISQELDEYKKRNRFFQLITAAPQQSVFQQHRRLLKMSYGALQGAILAEMLLTVEELRHWQRHPVPQSGQQDDPHSLSNAVWAQHFMRDYASFSESMQAALHQHSHSVITYQTWSQDPNVQLLKLPDSLLQKLFGLFDRDRNGNLDSQEVASLSVCVLHISKTFYDCARYEHTNKAGRESVPIADILFLLAARGYQYTDRDVQDIAHSVRHHFQWQTNPDGSRYPVAANYEGYLAMYLGIITLDFNVNALKTNMVHVQQMFQAARQQQLAAQMPVHPASRQNSNDYYWG